MGRTNGAQNKTLANVHPPRIQTGDYKATQTSLVTKFQLFKEREKGEAIEMARRRRRAPPRFQCLTTSRYLQQVAFCRAVKRNCSLTQRFLPAQDPIEEVHMKEVLMIEAPMEEALIEEASMEETPVEYSSTEISVNEAASRKEPEGKEVKARLERRCLEQKIRSHRREKQCQAVKKARGFAVGNVVNNVNINVENAHTVEMARLPLLRFQCVTSRHLQQAAFTRVVKRKRRSVQVPVEEVPMEEAPLEEASVEDYSVVEDCVDKEAAKKEAECVTSDHVQQVAFTRVVKRKRRSLQVPVEEVPVEEASVENSSTVEDSIDEEAARNEAECVTSRHLQQVAFTRVVKLKRRSVQVPVEEAAMEGSSVVEDSVDEDAARKEAECVTSRHLQQMAFTRVVKRQRRPVQVPVEETPLEEVPVEEAPMEDSSVEDYFIVDDSLNEEIARKEAEEQEEAQEAAAVEIAVYNVNNPVENVHTMDNAVANPVDNAVVNPVDNSPVDAYLIVDDCVNKETARKEAEEPEKAREADALEIAANNAVENAHTVENAVVESVNIADVNPVDDAVLNSVGIAVVNQVHCAMVDQVDCAMVNQVAAVASAMDYAEDYETDHSEDYATDCDEIEAEGVALKVTLTSTLPLRDAEIVKRKIHMGIPCQIVNRNFLNSSIGKLTTARGTLVKLKGELKNLMVYGGKRSYASISYLIKKLSKATKRWRN